MKSKYSATLLAILAAVLYAINIPFSKLLLNSVEPTMMAAFLYLGAGLGSLLVALILGEKLPGIPSMAAVLLLGFVAYGLSINFYIQAQASLGAAKTSAYYSIAPFLGVAFGMLLLKERPGVQFYVGLAIMIAATVLMVKDTIALQHTHEHAHTHTHPHRHGEQIHNHEHTHVHSHTHIHGSDENRHDHNHGDIPEHDHCHGT